MPRNYKDIRGMRHGNLTAIKPTDKRHDHSVIWLWRCDCGNEVERTANQVRQTKGMCPACAHKARVERGRHIAEKKKLHKTGCSVGVVRSIRNRTPYANSKSGIRGVCLNKQNFKWIASISVAKQFIVLGSFDTKEEAAACRAAAEKQFYGENTPENLEKLITLYRQRAKAETYKK